MRIYLQKNLLILFLINFISCSSNLDFEQALEIETTPIFNISLGFFKITSDGFTSNNASPITSVNEDIEYRIFENQILRDNITKQEYDIEINNTFNREFNITIAFLDFEENNTFNPVSYTVNANDTNFKETIVIDNIDSVNSNVKNTTTLRLTISLKDETRPLNQGSSGVFNFKSSTTVYLATTTKSKE